MTLSQRLIVSTLKSITSFICRVDDAELDKVPRHGPLILYTNHVNIIEIPIIYTHLQPRKVHGMLLAERWNNLILRWMLDVTNTIPVHRGEADIDAIRQGLNALERGEMIIIAPEGTRSHDGRLQAAHPGVVLLALHSATPVVPVAYYGAENYTQNLKRFSRTDLHIRVGAPFTLDAHGEKVTRMVREQMLEQMMVQLANLLPERYRGRYAGSAMVSTKYLMFL